MAEHDDAMVVPAVVTSTQVRAMLDDAAAQRTSGPEAARELALEARVRARADGDAAGEAEALYFLASIAHQVGDADDAFALAVESAELAAEAGSPLVESWAVHLVGVVHYQASNYSEALEQCLRALDLYRRADHEGSEATFLNTIASVYNSIGDADRAIVTYESALATSEPHGHGEFSAIVYGNIARIRASRGEYLIAVSLGHRAVALARDHAPDVVSNLLADLAEAYMGLADPSAAAECFAQARHAWTTRAEQGFDPPPPTKLGVMMAEGRVAIERGALDEAVAVLRTALDLAVRAGTREFELEIHDLLATTFKRCGRFEEALEHRERHDNQYREMFTAATDLRLRTLQIAHERAGASERAQTFRARARPRPGDADAPGTGGASMRGDGALDPVAAQLDAFERLAVLAEFHIANSGEHTERVGDLAAEIAHAVGASPEWGERLRLAARLHDIGKVAVPDAVLLKVAPLTVDEFETMKTHTVVGHQILAGSASPLFQLAAELAHSHHEWWDGGGYPDGRRGDDIPLSGRLVAIADVFDALCSQRVYKRAWPMSEAARFVVSGRGGQFDPRAVDGFVAVMRARHPELGHALDG